MTRRVFFSFDYERDNWRASQVRKIGALESDEPVTDNAWEEVTKGGDPAIQRWIDGQMARCSCVIVLIGAQTAGRKWINYEIRSAWNDRKGLFGIRINGLQNRDGHMDSKGANPFDKVTVGQTALTKHPISNFVQVYESGSINTDSRDVHSRIAAGIANWTETAIAARR